MQNRFIRLVTIAVDTEEKARVIPEGVWRRYCPLCRGEFLPDTAACPKCVEKLAETIQSFQEQARELATEQGLDPSDPKTLLRAERELLQRIEEALASAKTHGLEREARRLDTVHKMISAHMVKRKVDAKVRRALQSVEDPAERIKIEKKIRSEVPEGIREKLDLAVARLSEPARVAPTYQRKLQDYIHRAKAADRKVTTTYGAAKLLGFTDKEAFITFAVSHGVRPIMAFDVPGGAPEYMPEPRSGGIEQVQRQEPHSLHYAAWNIDDILRLRNILKTDEESGQLEEQAASLRKNIVSLESELGNMKAALARLDMLERQRPERLSEIHKKRNELRMQGDLLEQRLQERRKELEAIQARLSELKRR